MIEFLAAATHAMPAVPTKIVGFSWNTAGLALLNLLVGGAIVALIKNRPQLKKIEADREANLLSERAKAMDLMSRRLELLEAERTVDRHRLGNITACFDGLLMLLEMAPERAAEHVQRIKEMRKEQLIAEAIERSTVFQNRFHEAPEHD